MSWGSFGDALGVATGISPSPTVTRDQAAQIPYATIGFKIGGGPESLLILASQSQQDSIWTSSQRIAFFMTNGRIRQTSGLKWNLSQTSFAGADPVGTPALVDPPQQPFERHCDFGDVDQFQVEISSMFDVEGTETISILGSNIETIRVREKCESNKWSWSFENRYWIDRSSGFVWRSIQTIHPNLDALTVEVLRPIS